MRAEAWTSSRMGVPACDTADGAPPGLSLCLRDSLDSNTEDGPTGTLRRCAERRGGIAVQTTTSTAQQQAAGYHPALATVTVNRALDCERDRYHAAAVSTPVKIIFLSITLDGRIDI